MNLIWNITKNDLKNVTELENQLDIFRKSLMKWDRVYNRKQFFQNMEDFLSFVWNFKNKRLFHIFKHTEYFSKNKEFFSFLTTYYLRTMQIIESLHIWKVIKKWESFFDNFKSDYLINIYNETIKELSMMDISNCNTFLAIDVWTLSPTLLSVYENTDIKNIIWVSSSEESTYVAEEAVKSQKSSRMKFKYSDWRYCDYSIADIIHISSFTIRKKEILDTIAETWKDDVQILLSVPYLLWNILYENPLDDLHPRLFIANESLSVKNHFYQSVLLRKLNI